ncbi:M1 family metallopeptidase [Jatrophihabitans telluris]|uniref:Aminopeptidase N n=1 Tax=Jatrophihabitans telluris TaxID=2038343 RepID=A0ABY4QVK0_9ACTN|nr:M1 family metallopeptidase [Jatrophihabitans telluris]UQX87590.1 M1 family metallopeptidase [Jatrophihabitans telluris]
MIARKRLSTPAVLASAATGLLLLSGISPAVADSRSASRAGSAPALSAARARVQPTPGSSSGGDPYFPRQGNGGYDALGYRIHVEYTPSSHALKGHAIVRARATKALSKFNLDLRRTMKVTSVTVDGRAARFSQPARAVQELAITPAKALRKDQTFTVSVRYAGTTTPVTDPDGSPDGWIPTPDGAFVASEPQGSPSWFPVNDSPKDKALYAVSITVPKGITAVSNGNLLSARTAHGRTTWAWQLNQPVSSYLVTATVGKFTLTKGRTGKGVPYLIAVDPTQRSQSAKVLKKLPAMVDYFSSVYGRYPFGSAGAIVDNAPNVGYALETATRPVFDSAPDELTLAHELAHQWYGDDVTLARWRDIWLNEGFAEFSSWLWDEHSGGTSAAAHLSTLMAVPADDPVWSPPPGNPGSAAAIFSDSVYERGAATLQALREKLGDPVFFAVMRGWAGAHRYGNATVPEFVHFAGSVSGQDLTAFFQNWLYASGKPTR